MQGALQRHEDADGMVSHSCMMSTRPLCLLRPAAAAAASNNKQLQVNFHFTRLLLLLLLLQQVQTSTWPCAGYWWGCAL